MPYHLKGRRVLVTAGSRGVGALTAKKLGAEGCDVAINYVTSQHAAKEVAEEIVEGGSKAIILKGDAGKREDIEALVAETVKTLGGIDIIISNAGYTKMIPNFGDLHSMSDEDWDKCWTVNVLAQMQLLRAAEPHFNTNPDGGVFLMTSSVAGLRPGGSSMAYAVTKSAGLHLMKALAMTQGPKIRVNAVCPGLMLTDWAEGFGEEKINRMTNNAVLKTTSNVDDVADSFVMLAKNGSATGVELRIDGGLAPEMG